MNEGREFFLGLIRQMNGGQFVSLSAEGNWCVTCLQEVSVEPGVDLAADLRRQYLQALGFEIAVYPGDHELRSTLPDDLELMSLVFPPAWELRFLEKKLPQPLMMTGFWSVADEKQRIRALFEIDDNNHAVPKLRFMRRFFVVQRRYKRGWGVEIQDNLTDQTVFRFFPYEGGLWTRLSWRLRDRTRWGRRKSARELERIGRRWLSLHFPGWEDPTKWWDEDLPHQAT